MTIKAIIIEADRNYRMLISHHITSHWSNAKVTEYDPAESGRPSEGFRGAGNDLVVLGDPLGDERGVDWLRQFKTVKGFPPVLLVGDGGERDIVAAIKSGASDYISKANLSHESLIKILEEMLAVNENRTESSSANFTDALDGTGLKGYEIERRISGGDIASVYLTHDKKSGRDTVLKVLRQMPDADGSNVAFDRFLREFDLIGKIHHPNVVEIYDLCIADDHAYIAMEYCSRGSLKRRIRLGMYADRAEEIMRQIAEALDAIHAVGILHRDMKPTNVLFREDESVALIDFGLAKQAHLKGELTGTGEIFGTPYYMSPEQGHGEALDVRSDIYSLGVIFYEMLTGSKPYEGSTAMEVILKHARDPIPRLPEHLASYQPAIDKMIAKRPGHRFQTLSELLEWRPETV
jgi:DNA-binding NarL/FixJ family response regulator